MRLRGLRLRDLVALVVASLATISGLLAWSLGSVDLGIRLGYTEDGFAMVSEVRPESRAAEYGYFPGAAVVDLQLHDGSVAPKADSALPDLDTPNPNDRLRFATEAVPEPEIAYLYAVAVDPESPSLVTWGMSLDRSSLAAGLEGAGLLLLVGLALGGSGAAAVSRGWLGEAWRPEAMTAGVALAVPFVAQPPVATGTPLGMAAGTLVPAAAFLPLAWSLADRFPLEAWRPRLRWFTVALAVMAALLLGRTLLGYVGDTRDGRMLILASIPLVPAVALALSGARATRERLDILAFGMLPASAALIGVRTFPQAMPVLLAIGAVIGWHQLPRFLRGRIGRRPEHGASAVTLQAAVDALDEPLVRARRDLVALMIAGGAFVAGLIGCCEGWTVVVGAVAGAAVAFALQRGLMGIDWVPAAVPVGAAVATPLMALALSSGSFPPDAARLLLPAAAALPVAHYLAGRHPDQAWRRTLFAAAVVLVGVVALIVLGSPYGGPVNDPPTLGSASRLGTYLAMGFVALVPGIGSAIGRTDEGSIRAAGRLDLVAIGLTPGAAMTVLPGYSPNIWFLILWLVAVVAWRRLSIAPLLGLAQRTQRQRDLAVAAVEAERARLAADLHDDALQELSALVRRLDSAGDAEGAELARSVAERLRAITSDLRLPLLDDLGAGPALEWLVGRFRPLAQGDVRLERADPQRPPAGVELAVFRVAQEALANAVKHGRPPITVRYRVDPAGAVSLSVDDEGPGIAADAAEEALRAGHLGVANMQQRAEQIGALLDIRRWPGGGTHVALEWRPR